MTPNRCRWRLLGALPLLFATGCDDGGEGRRLAGEAGTAGRNLVVVLSDTHRADYISPHGGPTPHLELLARDGVTFTGARTPVPISAPAYATLLSGKLPAVHGVVNNQQHLGPALPLLPEELRAAGHATAAVVANPFCSAGHGFGRGFDHFWDDVEGHGKEGDVITAAALEWLAARPRERPFFLFLAYMDAHTPFLADAVPPSLLVQVDGEPAAVLRAENAHLRQRIPLLLAPGRSRLTLHYLEDLRPAKPEDGASPLYCGDFELAGEGVALTFGDGWEELPATTFRRLSHRAVLEVANDRGEEVAGELRFRCYRRYAEHEYLAYYGAGVRSFDHQLGRLVAALRDQGLYDDTIIVFVSDHGDMLGEHGVWGHVNDLYEETLHIPLVIKAPGLAPGSVHRGAFGLTDLHRLLLALATGEAPPGALSTAAAESPESVAATYPPESDALLVAVRRGSLKLLSDGGERWELYDLESDPAETTNLYPERREEPPVRALARRLTAELRRIAELRPLDPATLTAAERRQLEALGYLD